MNLTPENTMERILNGEDVTPSCRAEYFVKQAIDNAGSGGGSGSLPTPGAAGNVLTSTGTGWESAPPSVVEDYVVDFALSGSTPVPTHGGESATVAGIIAAKQAGKNVYGHLESGVLLDLRLINTAGYNSVLFAADYFDGTNSTIANVQYFGVGGETDTWLDFSTVMPRPTASDNGKILGVENGAYALVAPTLNIEGTMSGGNFTITNVTAAQINAAYMAHRPVYIDLPAMHARVYLQVCEYTDDTSYKFTFCNTQITSDGIVVIQASFNDSLTGDVDSKTAAAT